MTRQKPKPKQVERAAQIEVNKNPELPYRTLRSWLEEKINLSNIKNVSKVHAGFLWETETVQRYRINIWTTTYREDQLSPSTRIVHSFFIHYHSDEECIKDKTQAPKQKKDRIF